MRAVAARYGADRTVAFGDNVNDLPMMLAADHAVAVANALQEVKEAADEVIGTSVSRYAVANYIAGLRRAAGGGFPMKFTRDRPPELREIYPDSSVGCRG